MTRQVWVGDVPLGGGAPVSIQTMWDRPLQGIDPALLMTLEDLKSKGCDLIRFALPNIKSVDTVADLSRQSPMPIVGDVHFDHRIALKAIRGGIPKIRINPGNIGAEWKVEEILHCAAGEGCAIRIGANEGSLLGGGEGDPETRATLLVEAAEKNLEIFEKKGFRELVVSLKSSDIRVSYLANRMFRERHPHPLHLGITEAGPLLPAVVKSALGLGDLLKEGIGETIRISISDKIEQEVLAAGELLSALGLREDRIKVVSCPKCGRTSFDTHGFLESVKAELATLPLGITVAVMGCSVNGPGEASHADLGITGNGKKVILFRNGRKVRREELCFAKEAFLEELAFLQSSS